MACLKRLLSVFVTKDGQVSKTAIFLSLATFLMLFLWGFQSLFEGVELVDGWTVPAFSPGSATSVMGTLAALYLVNHSPLVRGKGVSAEDIEEMRQKVDRVVEAIERKDG